MAERTGFEPAVPYGTHRFQRCAFDHSATSPPCLGTMFYISQSNSRLDALPLYMGLKGYIDLYTIRLHSAKTTAR